MPCTPGTAAIFDATPAAGGDARRSRRGHVGAERELGVDVRLLVVGGGEEPDLDAERQQQRDDDEPAIDRSAAARRCSRAGSARELCAGPPAARLATQRQSRARGAARAASVAPIHRSAGAKNMYTDSDSVGFESGLTTAEKPVLAVSHQMSPLSASAATSRYSRCHSGLPSRRDDRRLSLTLARQTEAVAPTRAASAPATAIATHVAHRDRGARRREADAAADDQRHRGERDASADRACDEADHEALTGRRHKQPPPRRAAGAEQREVAPVTLDGTERREVRQPETDDRARERRA